MNYKNYQAARNAAWKILIDCGVNSLPVDVALVCRKLGCKLHSYSDGTQLIRLFGLEAQREKCDGFTVLYNGIPYIFFNEKVTLGRQRFTVAHELGHIMLGHLQEGRYTVANREPKPGDSPAETQANQFAARLLAPACVLNAINAVDADRISEVCEISYQAAEYRAERMAQLRERGRFLQHPLERRVLQQFGTFIQCHSPTA